MSNESTRVAVRYCPDTGSSYQYTEHLPVKSMCTPSFSIATNKQFLYLLVITSRLAIFQLITNPSSTLVFAPTAVCMPMRMMSDGTLAVVTYCGV